ncbi:MAG: GNAT family N-acetyltransferase [Burkholderiales bacterium]
MHALQMRAFAEEGRRLGTTDILPLTETVATIADDVRRHTALVARVDGVIVGCIRGIVGDGACSIRALVVEPAHHGRGIGSRLLRALEDAVPGVGRFKLTTNPVMEGNVPFYERHGYHVTEITQHSPTITLAQMAKRVAREG